MVHSGSDHSTGISRHDIRPSEILITALVFQADVTDDNEVFVEGVFVGRLVGLRFITDLSATSGDRRLLTASAHRGLQREIGRRVAELEKAEDADFNLSNDGNIYWKEQDPSPTTPENELLQELNDRVRFSNKNFSVPSPKKVLFVFA